ncbi:ankyrin repeat protein [Ostertagia ostertagi]
MFVSAWQEDEEGIQEGSLGDTTEKFLKEAENGNVDALKNMLQNNPELLSCCDDDGYTALHRAAYNNHLEAVTFLLECGADAEARVNEVLMDFGECNELIENTCIDIGIPSGSGDTPAELARRTSAMLHMLITDHLNR